MTWIIGIDEAGYGPNLGPFVTTAAAWRVEHATTDLWKVLSSWVRRAGEAADERLLVADSKVVFSPQHGLAELERAVLAFTRAPATFQDYLEQWFPATLDEIRGEFWFTGTTPLPHSVGTVTDSDELVRNCRVEGLTICPRRFNALLDKHDSKGAILAHGLHTLLERFQNLGEDAEPLCFFIDKHGGRNTYAAMLQHAFPDGLVLVHEEGRLRSVYDVVGLARPLRVTFQPRADQEHFCVALASMVSKYVRELCMMEFNTFWRNHLPELKPTAGYPTDAGRFLEEIRLVAERLAIPMDCLWRRK